MARASTPDIRIGPQGRLVIPAAVRKTLALKPGDSLSIRVEDGRLVLEKREQVWSRLKARFARVPAKVSLVEELLTERRAEAHSEHELQSRRRK